MFPTSFQQAIFHNFKLISRQLMMTTLTANSKIYRLAGVIYAKHRIICIPPNRLHIP